MAPTARLQSWRAAGEQQPEVDHAMESERSRKGTAQDHFYREASDGGYFSYSMATGKETDLSLLVRYWGAEWGNRKFGIYVDDQLLATVDNSNRWNQSRFFDVAYRIPADMLKGKDSVRIKFKALKGVVTSPVYYVRIIRDEGR